MSDAHPAVFTPPPQQDTENKMKKIINWDKGKEVSYQLSQQVKQIHSGENSIYCKLK